MTEWRCPAGHEASSRTGRAPDGCPQHDCEHDFVRVTPQMREFARSNGLDIEAVVDRRAES